MNGRDVFELTVLIALFNVAPISLAADVKGVDPGAPGAIVHVAIDQSKTLGPAEVIGDLIGSQYEPYTFGFRHPDPWGIGAWREVGFNISDIALFDFEGSNPFTVSGKIVGIHVRRDTAGNLRLDFSDFDKNINFMRHDLGAKKIDFTVWGTPKALADRAAGSIFFFSAPANYQEWAQIVQSAVRHIKDDLGLAGSSYKPWTEPDSGWYWRGRAREGQMATTAENATKIQQAIVKERPLLDDYVEKYVNDWHAIKGIDPAAKVGGPFSVYSTDLPGSAFSTDDFLTKIDAYNAAHPTSRVTVDELVYQDYNWHGNGLPEGVRGANALIAKQHLPATTPLVLAGWNNGMKNDQSLQQRAVYLVSNIIGELLPVGRPRTLSRAYIWPFDYDYYAVGLGPVIMPYPAVSYMGEDGSDAPMKIPAITERSKRPAHAGLLLLSHLKRGQLIAAQSSSAAVAVIAAVQPDERIQFVVTNYSPRSQRISASLSGTAKARNYTDITFQRVDANHSSDGTGLESGETRHVAIAANGELPSFDALPYSITGVTIH